MVLSNRKIALEFSDSALTKITDITRGKSYAIAESSYRIATDKGTFAESMRMVEHDGTSVTFAAAKDGFTVTSVYSLAGDTGFFEKEILVEYDGDFFVKDAVCEDIRFAEDFDNVRFHDDMTLWHCPENYFLEDCTGGLAMGLCYPHWVSAADKNSVTLGYELNFQASGKLTLEKIFCGVYRLEGITRYSHGPYPGKKAAPFSPGFGGTGLNQHFQKLLIPEDAGIGPEVLDWGAVWAMQDYMRYRLPRMPLPEEGFFLWQNGWWAGLANPEIESVEVLLDSGVSDIMTQQIAFGHDNHPNTEPRYIKDATYYPIMFPVYEGEEDDETELKAPTALHANVEARKELGIVGYTEEFIPPKRFSEFFKKARAMGMNIGSFTTPNNAYAVGEKWISTNEDGTPHTYFGRRLSCPACDEFMDFHFDVTCKMIDFGDKRFWAFDGRWQDFSELGGYYIESIEPDRCYSEGHGHLPGDNRYKEFRNIKKFVRGLREKYPTMCLEQYYGLKQGGIWMLDNFNSDENYYETSGPDNNRFQCWHNENSRFRPHYMNFANIIAKDFEEFKYAVISAISASSYAQIANGFHVLKSDVRAREFLKKWRGFASENINLLVNRRCLFDCQGFLPIDGSAHILGDTGYIFVFNTSDEWTFGRVPATRWIGLDEDTDAVYGISRVYPEESQMGAVRYGDSFILDTTPHTANIFKIQRTNAAPTEFAVPFGAVIVDAFSE